MTKKCTGLPTEPLPAPMATPLLPEEDYWARVFDFDIVAGTLATYGGGGEKWRSATAGDVVAAVMSQLRREMVPELERVILEVYLPTVTAELDRLADASAGPDMVRTRARQLGRMPDPLPLRIPDKAETKWEQAWRVITGRVRSGIWQARGEIDEPLATAITGSIWAGLTPLLSEAAARSALPVLIEELRRRAADGAGPDELTARADELDARLAEQERQGRA